MYPNTNQAPPAYAPVGYTTSPPPQPTTYGQPAYAGQPTYAPQPQYGAVPQASPQPMQVTIGGQQQMVYAVPQAGGGVQYVQAAPQPQIVVVQQQPVYVGGYGGSNSCCSSYLNYVLWFMLLLCWIACCVVFGGVLHVVQSSNSVVNEVDFYWNHLATQGQSISYSNSAVSASGLGQCQTGGIVYLICAVLAFVLCSLYMTLMLYRFGRLGNASFLSGQGSIKRAELDTMVTRELLLAVFNVVFFTVGLGVWSGTCLKQTINAYQGTGATIVSTGFGYWIFCFILSICCAAHASIIKSNPFHSAIGRQVA